MAKLNKILLVDDDEDLREALAVINGENGNGRSDAARAADLEAAVLAAAPAQSGLRLSTYGDLIAITDEGAQRVAVIEPKQWFPGHLA